MAHHGKKLIQSYIPGFVSTHKYIQELDQSYWTKLAKQEKQRLVELAEKRKNTINNLDMYDDSILELDLSYQKIEGILVLTRFTKLKKLNCSCNFICKIIGMFENLEQLDCSFNMLEYLEIPSSLVKLNCKYNQIRSIRLIQLVKPFDFDSTCNKISFDNSSSLRWLDCSNNNIYHDIEFSVFQLIKLSCYDNCIESFNNLNDGLEELVCVGNKLNTLDKLPQTLKLLDCSFNQIKNLKLLPTKLIKLYCSSNSIENIDKLPVLLEELDCSYNKICILNNLPVRLKILNCSFNNIITLDKLPYQLKILDCSANLIKNLDNLPQELEILSCIYNKLTSLDYLPSSLINLNCSLNKISKLDNLPCLLEELNISNHKYGKYIDDDEYDKITKLHKLDNLPTGLKILYCSGNNIKTLNNLPTGLEVLKCFQLDETIPKILFIPPKIDMSNVIEENIYFICTHKTRYGTNKYYKKFLKFVMI